MNKKFKQWMLESSAKEKAKLAKDANTSVTYLYQLAAGDRKASAELAGKIEKAFTKVGVFGAHGLDELTRGDLCEACSQCPYFKQCKGK